jgi:hypothetical protein
MHNETTSPLSFWTLLLSISTRFEMNRVRSRAITEINIFHPRIDPVDQVVLAVRHSVPEWLPQAYAAICKRAKPIEIDDARKLGLETTVLLAKAREGVRNLQKPRVHAHIPQDANVPTERCRAPVQDTLEQVPYNMDSEWNIAAPSEPCSLIMTDRRHPGDSPKIAHTVSMQAETLGHGVIDDSLVRHVIDDIFRPPSEPPSAKVSDQIKDLSTALSSNRLLTFV